MYWFSIDANFGEGMISFSVRNYQPWQSCTQFWSRIKSIKMSKRHHSGLGYSGDFVKGDHAFGRWTLEFLLLSFQSLRECFKIFHFSDGRWSAGRISWSCSTSSRIAPNCLPIQVPCIWWPPWEVLVHRKLACIETNGWGGNLTQPSNHFICVSTGAISSASHWCDRGSRATSTIKTQQRTFFVDVLCWNGTIHVPWQWAFSTPQSNLSCWYGGLLACRTAPCSCRGQTGCCCLWHSLPPSSFNPILSPIEQKV